MYAARTTADDDRGVSEVVGLVLLVGIVTVGSVAVLVIGGQVQGDTEDQISDTRVENSFVQLDERIETVSTGQQPRATVDFDLANSAADDTAIRREATGTIYVNRTNLTATRTVAVKEIGSIVYTRDGERYAYQAGAVWRNSGNATEMVSPPQVSYEFSADDGRASPTLNLGLPELQGSDRLGTGEVRVLHNQTIAPFNNVSTVDNELVTLSVTSEYYVGWGEYFADRYPEVTTVGYDHPNDTVTIAFGKREIDGNFTGSIVAGGPLYAGNGAPSIDDSAIAGSTPPNTGPGGPNDADCKASGGTIDCTGTPSNTPLDPVLESEVQRAKTGAVDKSGVIGNGTDTHLTAGEYYSDGFVLNGEELEMNLTDGNISLFVDGPIGVKGGEIEVTNPNQNSSCCFARVYVADLDGDGGDFAMTNGGVISATDDEAQHFQLYGTSEMHFGLGQGSTVYRGTVYAPHGGDKANGTNQAVAAYGLSSANSSAGCSGGDVCIGVGNPTFNGSMVGFHDVDAAQSANVDYDPSVANVDPTLGYAGTVPPPITYLQVTVNKVCVGGDDVAAC